MTQNRKIALITGGSRGLGRSTAENLARRSVDSVVTYRFGADEARAVVAAVETMGGRAVALPLDTAVVSGFGAFVDQLKRSLRDAWGRDTFDYLVNNAGSALNKSIAEPTEEEFDGMMNVHLKGVFFLTQALLPLIADGGRIINMSSGLARYAMPGASAYAMMKGGIEVFTRSLARELGERQITANTIAPGAIETDFAGGALRNNAKLKGMLTQMTALGRTGVADDVGPMIASMLSEDNRWVNGQRIEVSGGMNI